MLGQPGIEAALFPFFRDGQVPGLEQQCLAAACIEFEFRDQGRVHCAVFQLHETDLPLRQHPVQVAGLTGAEPVGPEFMFVKQVENVVRVAGLLLAQPVVAVVPGAAPVQFRGSHGIQIVVRICADGRQWWVETDVRETVQSRREAGLCNHRDAGDEDNTEVLSGILQDAVDVPGTIPAGPGVLVLLRHIQDRPVLFVNRHCHRLTGRPGQPDPDAPQPLGSGCCRRQGLQVQCRLDCVRMIQDGMMQFLMRTDTATEAGTNYRLPYRPVPVRVEVQPPEPGSLVDMVTALVPKSAKCLHPYWQGTAFHPSFCTHNMTILAW